MKENKIRELLRIEIELPIGVARTVPAQSLLGAVMFVAMFLSLPKETCSYS